MKLNGNEREQDILRELGTRIRQYRIGLNITQAELADRCGISPSTEVRIESGVDSKISNYIKILKSLGLAPNLDLLIPEPQPDFKALYERKPVRQRARSNKSGSGWVWGEDE